MSGERNPNFAPLDREPSGSQTPSEPEGSRSARVAKHSLVIAGHRTSVSLERAFWERLKTIADEDECSLAALVAKIDAGRGKANLSSALRVYALERALTKASRLEHKGRAPLPACGERLGEGPGD